jgi:hypothetical protein
MCNLVPLWLKTANDEAFVAVDPMYSPVIAGVAYSRADLERALVAPAAERLKCDDVPMLFVRRLSTRPFLEMLVSVYDRIHVQFMTTPPGCSFPPQVAQGVKVSPTV